MADSLPLLHVVGDSISLEYGPPLEKFLAGHWRYERKSDQGEALLNLDRPQGANGGDSSMVLAYLQAVMARGDFRPDLLLVNCGLHDIKVGCASGALQIALPDYEKNLREIVRLAADRAVPLAWVRTTHVCDEIHNARPGMDFHRHAKDHAAYDEAACRIMAESRVPAIDLGGFTRKLGTDRELFRDHVHFHAPVSERQASFLAGWLIAWHESRD